MSGEVPEGWSTTKLSERLNLVQESINQTSLSNLKRVSLYSLPGFDDNMTVARLAGEVIGSSKYRVPSNCVLFSKLNPRIPRVWRVRTSEPNAVCSTEFWPLIPIQGNIDLDYVCYYLSSSIVLENPLIKPASSTNSHQRVDRSSFERLPCNWPPLPEQKKIAAILSSVDEAIQATQAVLSQTRRVKQGLLQDLLTRGIGHTRFKQTEIGEIPEGWCLSRIEDFCDVRRGASPRPIRDPKWFSGSGPGWVRIADVTASDRYLRRTTQCLSALGAERSVRVGPGDLIMSIAATVGVPIVVDMDACVHDGFVVFRELQDHVQVEFLRYALEQAGEALARQGQTGTQKNVNTSIVGEMFVAVPPISEQRHIIKILQQVDSLVTLMTTNLDQLQQVKAGLLHDLLTGKVRVSP